MWHETLLRLTRPTRTQPPRPGRQDRRSSDQRTGGVRLPAFSIRSKFILPVLLVGLVAICSDLYISNLADHHRQEIARSQKLSLGMIGKALDASANLATADRLVTRALREPDIPEDERRAMARKIRMIADQMRLSVANYDYRRIGLLTHESLETINETIASWRDAATDIVESTDGRAEWQIIDFTERDKQLDFYLGRLLDRTHDHASKVADESQQAIRKAHTQAILLVVACIVFIVCLAVFVASRLASTLTRISVAMRQLAGGRLDVAIVGEDRRDELGDLVRSLNVFRAAMTDVVNTKSAMEQMALTDALTGLPNRRGLTEFFSMLGSRPHMRGKMIGILHVDLDHFKTVNDTMGHDAGDHVLKIASERMSGVIRRSDILARIGGDEFVAVLPDIPEISTVEGLCTRIIEQFDAPIVYEDQACLIGASIGAVHQVFVPEEAELDDLLSNADIALCAVKASGRGALRVFDETMGRRREDQIDAARDIARGLAYDEFDAWFQPMVETTTGAVTGIELLARWIHPDRGVLLPEAFLKAAEAHNLLDELGSQVLERGCGALKTLRGFQQVLPQVHLNISRPQLLSRTMVDQVCWILDTANIPPSGVAIEVSEATCSGRSSEAVMANLYRLRDLGHPVVLDEFGHTNASVSNLARTGARQLKITRGVFDPEHLVDQSADRTFLTRAALSVGETLGVSVIAKGVETTAQISEMRRLGVSEMQGNAIAPPMVMDDLIRWLEGRATLGDGSADARISSERRVGS